ncbi:hypothetical protein BGZ73_000334 [Actinomortierella ambigua]|nr:hypothetical protein BGZ73_000334 [Actinomortierella ambigua]
MNTVLEEESDDVEEEAGENRSPCSTAEDEHKLDISASGTLSAGYAAQPTSGYSSPHHLTTKPTCLGGLEFRPEVYAYKMRLARAARARFTKQSASSNQRTTATTTATTTSSAPVDDVVESASPSSLPSTPGTDMHAQVAASAAAVTSVGEPSPSSSSPSQTPLEQLVIYQDKERPDKRLMQQLLSLENKIPRIVRKWAHHARHFFAEELMCEDSIAQKWVDEQRIEVVLGTGCHGHLLTSTASLTFQQLQQQHNHSHQPPSSSLTTTTTSAMLPSTATPPSPLPIYANHQQHHHSPQQQEQLHHANSSSREHHEQPHASSAAHMQQHLQQTMTNTPNTHSSSTTMTTTTKTMNTITTSMTSSSIHSPRLITGGTTPVTTFTPRATSFAEGIRLSRHGSHQGQSTGAAQHRTSLRNSVSFGPNGAIGPAAIGTTTTTTGYHQRVSTSQQMLSLHLWLSCLVSPISPDQMVHEGFFEPIDPQVYP